MSAFSNNSVTLKGAVAIAALIAGGTLEFTRISVGDGNIPTGQTPLTMTDLAHRLFDVDINEVYSDTESQATVIGVFNNSAVETGFYYRELGLFAKDPETGAEILYCYGNAGDEAEWISPAGSESVIEKEVHIVTLVGNATNVTANIKSGIYPTKSELNAEVVKINAALSLKADLDKTAAEGGRVVASQMRFDETQTLYVDAAATAEGADGSEAKPFKTFAAAVSAFYAGARVVLIKAKAGTYNEDITVQNAPGTLFHFLRNGEGIVSIRSLTAIFTQVYMGDFTITGKTEGNAVTFSNVSNFAMQRVNVGGTSDTSGIASYNSKGFLETVAINGCGTAFEARDSSQVALRGVSGSGNSVGLASFESVVTVAELTMTATTLYVTGNGGAINTDGALSTYPSSQGHLYSLGGFATSAELRTRLAQEFGKLKEGDFKAFQFWNNIIGNFGTFISSQTMHVSLHKTSNDGGGYGIAHFYAHRDDGAAYMQFVNGGFTTETPIPLAKWQIINDATANVGDLTTGIYTIQSGSNGTAGVPTAQNGTLICDRNVGVPYQIYITDYENVMYKRIFADGAWQAWSRFPGIATTSEYGLIRLASESDVLQEADNKVMDVPLAYELNDFRRMSKSYSVGDKVNCAFKFEYFLECIQSGTTSAESLDTRNVTHGQVIEDGTAKWTVRTHVKSVNNAVPDANGNITVETGGVKTVNGNEPDDNGNITPDQTGCLPLSGGTMTGNIRFTNGAYITGLNGSEYKSIDVANNGWSVGGAGLTLRKADSPKESGQFGLMASNGTQSKTLIGTPGGSLMWNGVQLVRSVNGTNADSNGNINISSFTFDCSLNGWYRDDKTGFMIQWGEIAARTGNNRYNFARSFPNYLLSISVQSVTKPTNPYKCVFIVSSYDKNGFNGGNDDTSTTAKYIAIGY